MDQALVPAPVVSSWAQALTVGAAIDSPSAADIELLAEVSVPLEVGGAIACLVGGIPDLLTDTQQADGSVPVEAGVAGARYSVPDLASSATGALAEVVLEESVGRADAGQIGGQILTPCAGSGLEAEGSIPSSASGAFAGETEDVPCLSVLAGVVLGTSEPVPSSAVGADAAVGGSLEHLSGGAREAKGSSPAQAGRALADIGGDVEELDGGAQQLAPGAVPEVAVSTLDAGAHGGGVAAGGAEGNTLPVVGEGVAGAV